VITDHPDNPDFKVKWLQQEEREN
jgi:hypothetical protein